MESSFAIRFLSGEARAFTRQLLRTQDQVIKNYLVGTDDNSMAKMAELGLSLETLGDLRKFVEQMSDWQLQNVSKLFFGGALNLNQAPYIVGPVAKRMSELEGPALGGFLSDVIVQWLSGATFTSIRKQSKFADCVIRP